MGMHTVRTNLIERKMPNSISTESRPEFGTLVPNGCGVNMQVSDESWDLNRRISGKTQSRSWPNRLLRSKYNLMVNLVVTTDNIQSLMRSGMGKHHEEHVKRLVNDYAKSPNLYML